MEGGSEDVREVKFGIYRTPEAFLKEALRMRQPFDEPSTSDMWARNREIPGAGSFQKGGGFNIRGTGLLLYANIIAFIC